MTQPSRRQIIPASNTLKLKVGAGFSGIDPMALARAEAAVKGLADQFSQWMQDEITKLDAARARITQEGYNADTAEALYFRSHDLKGLGATYGYPVVTGIADSMGRLISDPATRLKAPLLLLDAHIAAIKAAVRTNIRDVDNPIAKTLLDELRAQVREYECYRPSTDALTR